MISVEKAHNGKWELVGEDNNGTTVLVEPGMYYGTRDEAQDVADTWNDSNAFEERQAEQQADDESEMYA